MKKNALGWLFLFIFCYLSANYEPQSLIFSTIQEISISGYQQDYVETDCGWFNKIAEDYKVGNILLLCEYDIDPQIGQEFCYLINYADSISVDSLMVVFDNEPKVELVEPDFYLTPLVSDPFFYEQWGLNSIKMIDVWNDGHLNYFGNNMKVGIVDSGIDLGLNTLPDHPDLEQNLFDDGNGNHGYNAYGYVTQTPNSEFNIQDDIGHGTAVAGIIRGKSFLQVFI